MSYNTQSNTRESAAMPQRVRDVLGRLKITAHQNVYEADFEYGTQPLRWEPLTVGSGTVTAIPNTGGVRMRVTNAAGDVSLRQSRPYHRYQPGKTMFMATGAQLGPATTGQIQRLGVFDDNNGVFFEQGVATNTNPFGMYVVIRSDVGGTVQETRVGLDQWNGEKGLISSLNFNRIQMFWIEYAWYGAGATRFGFWINGEPVIAHQIGWGNYYNTNITPNADNTTPWARTGNLPVRYEIRNLAAVTPTTSDMFHYGVSVIIEGQRDEQRGFTYSYGLPNTVQTRSVASATNRLPLLTIRGRQLGTQEYGTVYAAATGSLISSVGTALSANFTGSISGTTLTVTSTQSGTVAVNQQLTGVGIIQGTYIVSGSGSTFTVNVAQTVASTAGIVGYALPIVLSAAVLPINGYQGRYIFFPGQGGGANDRNGVVGRVITNQALTLYIADPITGGALTTTPSVQTTQTPTASAGVTGGYTFTVSSATGITAGMGVTGTGIPLGSIVTNVVSTTVTINQPLTANSSGTATFVTGYCIGLINRGQLLPRRLMVSSDTRCVVEVIAGSISNPSALTGANFVPMAASGSLNSFAERDFSATVVTGGEVVFAFTLASGSGLQDIDFSYFFPLYNSIRGTQIDQLTVAITTISGTTSVVGAHLICQEAMS